MKFAPTLIAGALMLLSSVASAGTFAVRDSQNLLSSGDVSALSADAKQWPFDVHLLVENAQSVQGLEDDAHAWVDGPNVVVLALDPQHHKTVARFGTGTGVKTGDFDTIAKAGNTHFRAKEWKQGVDSVVLRAQASAQAKQAISASTDPVVVERGLSTSTWLLLALLVASFAGLTIWLWRRSKRERAQYESVLNETREEASELRSRNIKDQRWEDRVASTSRSRPDGYGRPSAAPVIINNSSGSSGVGDFASGYVVGSLLTDHGVDQRGYIRDVPVAPAPVPPAPTPSPSYSSDSGGSSSSYSGSSSSYSSSDSSPSYDSGGSSSSYDSGGSSSFDSGGGGFDSGGGGFDSGGGGGDW